MEDLFQSEIGSRENVEYKFSTDEHQEGGSPYPQMSSMSPVKLMRQVNSNTSVLCSLNIFVQSMLVCNMS